MSQPELTEKEEAKVRLNGISLFYLGGDNPSGVNGFASVPGLADRPPLTFVSGSTSVFVLSPQDQQYGCRELNLTGVLHGCRILGIAVSVSTQAPDDVWLLIASVSRPAKAHLSIVKYDRNSFGYRSWTSPR